jgi:hypothetical protein
MLSKEDTGDPDHISTEGGGPAHNTTLDVLDGRLPGRPTTPSLSATVFFEAGGIPLGGIRGHGA